MEGLPVLYCLSNFHTNLRIEKRLIHEQPMGNCMLDDHIYGSCKLLSKPNKDHMPAMGMGYAWMLTGRENYLLVPLVAFEDWTRLLLKDVHRPIEAGWMRSTVSFAALVERTLGTDWRRYAREGHLSDHSASSQLPK